MKIFTIENVLPRQRVKRHTGLIKAPRRQQFLANESAHTDHLSVKKPPVLVCSERTRKMRKETISKFTVKKDVIVTSIRGLRISPAEFFATVTLP